jgi:sigma-B regulation protein RsbU (phosphoserine phosphatase)
MDATHEMLHTADLGKNFGEHLELLAEMGQNFSSSLDIADTLGKALSRISGYLDAEAASLFLLENDDRSLICRACFGPTDITGLAIGPTQGIVGRAIQDNECQMVRDVRIDPDFAKSVDENSGFTTRSILCAPLSVKDRRVGAIELLNKVGGDGLFSEQDRQVLRVLATSAALAIINARLTSALIEQEKVRRELELAAEIQRNLLPRRRPDGFPVNGINVPARGVSGDFFDIFTLPDGRVCFNVGDVSGKGMNAALLMAKTSSLYHCLGKAVHDPGKLLGMVNAEICETGARGMFVTMVGGVYDPTSGIVRFANAGHEPPLFRDGEGGYVAWPAEAPPLGIAADLVGAEGYPVTELELDGGVFSVFTDGVTEGRLETTEMLGVEGFMRLAERFDSLVPMERIGAIVAQLNRPGTILHDDLTILMIDDRADRMRRAR